MSCSALCVCAVRVCGRITDVLKQGVLKHNAALIHFGPVTRPLGRKRRRIFREEVYVCAFLSLASLSGSSEPGLNRSFSPEQALSLSELHLMERML